MKTKALGLICIYFITISNAFAQSKNLEIPVSPKGKKEMILKRKNYTLSFNKELNIPNWVAWRLDKEKLVERVSRKGYSFKPDPEINPSQAVVTQDYAHSGYDRGHMCPAGDSRWSGEAMKESFYMTNICPQHPNLNGEIGMNWSKLADDGHQKVLSTLFVVLYFIKRKNRNALERNIKSGCRKLSSKLYWQELRKESLELSDSFIRIQQVTALWMRMLTPSTKWNV